MRGVLRTDIEMRVLVIGDDPESRLVAERAVVGQGWDVVAADTASALRVARDGAVDVIVCDTVTPHTRADTQPAGVSVVSRLRSAGVATPVLVISDDGGEPAQATGFTSGADAYLVTPFSALVLRAQLRAWLRRSALTCSPTARLRVGKLVLDPASGTASWDGQQVRLGGRRFRVLYALAQRRARVVSGSELLDVAWGDRPGTHLNTVEVAISVLRRQLHPLGAAHLIQTRYRHGYQLHYPLPTPDGEPLVESTPNW